MSKTDDGFAVTRGQGFQIRFKNGYRISVQFGINHYCSNRFKRNKEADSEFWESKTAEIAILSPSGFHRPSEWGDDVHGHCTPDEVVYWIIYTQMLSAINGADRGE
jgi:hypothetical protein